MKKAIVLLAEGFEEVEALTPVDYLRRAGVEVTLAGVGGRDVTGSHGIRVDTDLALDELEEELFDAVVVPGGLPGASNLAASPEVVALVRRHFAAGRLVASICAAPALVLHGACGILAGRRFTGYPGTEKGVEGATFAAGRVVVDGNLVTSRAAGCAGEFAVAIVAELLGEETARGLADRVLLG